MNLYAGKSEVIESHRAAGSVAIGIERGDDEAHLLILFRNIGEYIGRHPFFGAVDILFYCSDLLGLGNGSVLSGSHVDIESVTEHHAFRGRIEVELHGRGLTGFGIEHRGNQQVVLLCARTDITQYPLTRGRGGGDRQIFYGLAEERFLTGGGPPGGNQGNAGEKGIVLEVIEKSFRIRRGFLGGP